MQNKGDKKRRQAITWIHQVRAKAKRQRLGKELLGDDHSLPAARSKRFFDRLSISEICDVSDAPDKGRALLVDRSLKGPRNSLTSARSSCLFLR